MKDAANLHEGAKGTSLFDARMIELQKEYTRQLLTHRNPYTGKALHRRSRRCHREINNENAINIGYRAPSKFYEDELAGIYNQWLSKHRTPAQIESLRELAHAASGAPIPLMSWHGQSSSAPPERFNTEAEFYNDLQRDYFDDMKSYLKQTLGSGSLIMATADHSHSGSGYPVLMATQHMDIIDGHTYWQHPSTTSTSCPWVNDPLNSTVVELARSAEQSKPYTVSERQQPIPQRLRRRRHPHPRRYGAFQDWDAIYWYTFEPKPDPAWKPYVGDAFDIFARPGEDARAGLRRVALSSRRH